MVSIERLALQHIRRLAELRIENYADLVRVNPMPPEETGLEDVRRRLERAVLDGRDDRGAFVILVDGEIAGDLSLNQIVRYPLDYANVGIFVAAGYRDRGVATEAIRQLCEVAFGELGLHRLEAGVQPFNIASIRAFEKNGFIRIGLAEQMLFVNGAWRDHLLVQKLAPAVAS